MQENYIFTCHQVIWQISPPNIFSLFLQHSRKQMALLNQENCPTEEKDGKTRHRNEIKQVKAVPTGKPDTAWVHSDTQKFSGTAFCSKKKENLPWVYILWQIREENMLEMWFILRFVQMGILIGFHQCLKVFPAHFLSRIFCYWPKQKPLLKHCAANSFNNGHVTVQETICSTVLVIHAIMQNMI